MPSYKSPCIRIENGFSFAFTMYIYLWRHLYEVCEALLKAVVNKLDSVRFMLFFSLSVFSLPPTLYIFSKINTVRRRCTGCFVLERFLRKWCYVVRFNVMGLMMIICTLQTTFTSCLYIKFITIPPQKI